MNSGWNTEELSGISETLERIEAAKYELDNCIRGCITGCHTYAELEQYLKDLATTLSEYADGIGYLDDIETEEED